MLWTETTIETSRTMLCTKVTVRFKADYTAMKILEMIGLNKLYFTLVRYTYKYIQLQKTASFECLVYTFNVLWPSLFSRVYVK